MKLNINPSSSCGAIEIKIQNVNVRKSQTITKVILTQLKQKTKIEAAVHYVAVFGTTFFI